MCLSTRLKDLEGETDQPAAFDLAQRMSLRPESLDSEFRTHHYALVDLVDDEGVLGKEQIF